MVLSTALLLSVAVLSLQYSAAVGSSASVNPTLDPTPTLTPTPTPAQFSLPDGVTLLDLQRQAAVIVLLDTTLAEWSSSLKSEFTTMLVLACGAFCQSPSWSYCNMTVSPNFTTDDFIYLPGYPTVIEASNIEIAFSVLLPENNSHPILSQNMLVNILLGIRTGLEAILEKVVTGIAAFEIPVEISSSSVDISTFIYSTPSPTPPPPTHRPTTIQEWEENAITLLLSQVSVEDWNASTYLQQTFKEVMAEEVSEYCSSSPALCKIDISTSTGQRRQAANSVTFSESDVLILPGYPKDFEEHLQVVFAVKLPDAVALLSSTSVPLIPQSILLTISLETTSELATRTGVHIVAVGPYQPPDQPGSNVGLTVGISVSTVIVLLGFIGISAWLLVTIIRTKRTQDMYDSANYLATESPNIVLLSYKPLVLDTPDLSHDLERHFTGANSIDVDIDWSHVHQ